MEFCYALMEFVFLIYYLLMIALFFCQATLEECQYLLHLLGCYEAASVQEINRQKKVYFL